MQILNCWCNVDIPTESLLLLFSNVVWSYIAAICISRRAQWIMQLGKSEWLWTPFRSPNEISLATLDKLTICAWQKPFSMTVTQSGAPLCMYFVSFCGGSFAKDIRWSNSSSWELKLSFRNMSGTTCKIWRPLFRYVFTRIWSVRIKVTIQCISHSNSVS